MVAEELALALATAQQVLELAVLVRRRLTMVFRVLEQICQQGPAYLNQQVGVFYYRIQQTGQLALLVSLLATQAHHLCRVSDHLYPKLQIEPQL